MAFFNSKVSRFLIGDVNGVQRDLSPYLTDVRGLPGGRALNEVTALGDSGARFIPGLEDVAFTLAGIFDDTAGSGPDAALGPLRSHTSAVDFEYGPEGTGAGGVKYLSASAGWSHTSFGAGSAAGSSGRRNCRSKGWLVGGVSSG